MTFHASLRQAGLAATIAFGASAAQAATLYNVTPITLAAPPGANALVSSLNDSGQVLWSLVPDTGTNPLASSRAFLFSAAQGSNGVGPLGFEGTWLNNEGQAVGEVYGTDGQKPVLLDVATGQMTTLATRSSMPIEFPSRITDRGAIYGESMPNHDAGAPEHAVRLGKRGGVRDLQGASDPWDGWLTGVNAKGEALLNESMYMSNDQYVAIYTPGAGVQQLAQPYTQAGVGLTPDGAFTGTMEVGSPPVMAAYIYRNGAFTLLPQLPGATQSQGIAINDGGMIIGMNTIPGGAPTPFLWSDQTGTVPLQSLLAPSAAGCVLDGVSALSNTGYIVAKGRCGGASADSYLLLSPAQQ